MFSFTQGDAESFNQKINLRILTHPSTTLPNTTVARRFPFSIMQSALDATFQPNVLLLLRHLATHGETSQWVAGKPYGYVHPTALKEAPGDASKDSGPPEEQPCTTLCLNNMYTLTHTNAHGRTKHAHAHTHLQAHTHTLASTHTRTHPQSYLQPNNHHTTQWCIEPTVQGMPSRSFCDSGARKCLVPDSVT